MIKIIIKALVVIVVVFGSINYLSYIKTGKSLIDLNQLVIPKMSLESSDIKKLVPTQKLKEKDGLYKWVNDKGVTQYTQQPPPKPIAFELISVNPNANILPEVKASVTEQTTHLDSNQDINLSYIPENIEKLIKDAKDVQKQLDERAAQQKKQLDNL